MLSLFADQEREAKLDSLGDPLALLDKHVDFAALAAVGDEVVTFARLGFQPRADAGIAWRVDDEHGMAHIVQGPGDGFAQAAAAARDQGGTLFSRHCGHRSCPVPPCPVPRPTRLPTV